MKLRDFIALIAIAMLPLPSCSAPSGEAKEQANAAENETKGNFAFLTDLGIDVAQANVITDKLASGDDHNSRIISLNGKQTLALMRHLERVPDPELGIEGAYNIEALKALPGGRTMILFLVGYGDGSNQLIATYSPQGEMIDMMDCGSWSELSTASCNDEMTQGQSRGTEAQLTFSAPDEFAVDRTVKMFDWTRKRADDDLTPTKTYWQLDKRYRYRIDADGRIVWLGTDRKATGEIDAEFGMADDISDLGKLPMSDPQRVDRLCQKAAEIDRAQQTGTASEDWDYYLQMVVSDMYYHSPQALLQWLCDNRGKSEPVVTLFKELFTSGWQPKDRLVSDIDRLPDPADRQYLHELTAQWGPEDAVG